MKNFENEELRGILASRNEGFDDEGLRGYAGV